LNFAETPAQSITCENEVFKWGLTTLAFLAALGALGGWMGGARVAKPTLRVAFWGAAAMAVTAGIGALVSKRSERRQRPERTRFRSGARQ